MRVLLRALAALCLFMPSTVFARPLVVDDLLRLRELASTSVDPSGRWLILEVEAPYDQAPRFESWAFSRTVRSRLWIVDLQRPGPARLAFPQRAGGGYLPGSFSPSGRAMLVFRDIGGRREAGILTLRSGVVRWLGVGADMADDGDTAVWRSETQVLLLALDAEDAPLQDRLQLSAVTTLPRFWRQSLTGSGPSVVTQGSGVFRDVHPKEPDRRLLLVDVETGQQRELARGDYSSFALSRSGQHAALIVAGDRLQPDPTVLLAPGSQWRRHGVQMLDLKTGALRSPCGDCDVLASSLRWSVQDNLLFFAKAPDQDWPQGRLMRLGAGRTVAMPVSTPGLRVAFSYAHLTVIAAVHADWLGEDPIVYAEPDIGEAKRADWYRLAAGGPIALTSDLVSAPTQLGAITGDVVLLTSGDTVWSINALGLAHRVFSAAGLKRLQASAPYTTTRSGIDAPDLETTVRIATADGAAADIGVNGVNWRIPGRGLEPSSGASSTGFGVAVRDTPVRLATPSGALLVSRDPHGVRRIALQDPEGRSTVLMTLNPQLAAIDWSTPMPIDDPGPHGEPFKDWLYLPSTYRVGDRLPLVVIGYPGMTLPDPPYDGLPGNLGLDDNPQLIAAHGYAALIPSVPLDPDRTDFGAGLKAAMSHALEAVIAHGAVDPDRIAFWGHSGGGYMALRLATETSRFRAIIAAAGTYDLISMRGQTRPSSPLVADWPMDSLFSGGWGELGQGHLQATLWSNPARFIRSSPLLFADKITTPILLVQGDQDLTGLGQGQEMFSALYRLRKDALFMSFYGEGHTISSPPNVQAYVEGAFAFLDRYLGRRAIGAP